MQIIIKNKDTLLYDEFKFKCSIGKNGLTSKKVEGDKKTPKGIFGLGPIYYRKDRLSKPQSKLKKIPITKTLGWCDDIKSKLYNKKRLLFWIFHHWCVVVCSITIASIDC